MARRVRLPPRSRPGAVPALAVPRGAVPLTLDAYRLYVQPGDGVVARFPHAAVFLLEQGSGDGVTALLELFREASVQDGQALGERIEAVVATTSVPAFGALLDTADQAVLVLHGQVEAQMESGGVPSRFTGPSHDRVLREALPAMPDAIVLQPEGTELDGDRPYLDLRVGVVPGSGLGALRVVVASPILAEAGGSPILDGEDEDTPDAPPVLPPPPPENPTEPPPSRVPPGIALPVPPAPSVETDATTEVSRATPMVWGARCQRDHFNRPDALYCATCGIGMHSVTPALVRRPRPPLGFLVLDEGSTYTLDTDWVLGRQPELDDSVRDGKAKPLAVTDPELAVSRTHLAVQLHDWDVVLIDRGSANGTYIRPPGRSDWIPLIPHQPTTIHSGTEVQLGPRGFVFEALNRL